MTEKTKKRIKNVASLGIRKAYVEIKRAIRNNGGGGGGGGGAVLAPILPIVHVDPERTNTPLSPIRDGYDGHGQYSLAELHEHVTAYENARYYHATKDRNVDSILTTGLDRNYGGHVEGASGTSDPGSQDGNRGKVFVGGDRKTALYYEQQLRADKTATPETLRVFVTPDVQDTLVADTGDDDNEAYWTGLHNVPGNQILRGKIKGRDPEELRPVFSVVRQWYPNPNGVTVEEVIDRHQEAIERGLTVHAERPGRLMRGRFIRDVEKAPRRGIERGYDDGYESD